MGLAKRSFLSTGDSGPTVLLIGVFTLMRLVVAPSFGLGVDEAHYVLYGLYPDLSYVDHPPLVGWVQAVMIALLGSGEFAARLAAVLLMAATSWGAYRFLLAAGADGRQAFWGVAALNASFMFGALGLMLLPENFLLALVFPLMTLVMRIERGGTARDFALLGLVLGLCGLAKYTAILLVPALFGYLAARRRYDVLRDPRIVLTIVIGAVAVAPVIVWNARHGWISFVYQSSHVAGGSAPALKPFLKSLSAQFGAYNPLLFLIAVYGWGYAARRGTGIAALAWWIGTTVGVFFLATSFLKPVLPHWPALAYVLFIPLGVVALLRRGWTRTVKGAVVFSLLLSVAVHAELAGQWGKFPDERSPLRDIYGYDEVARHGAALLEPVHGARKALAVTNWTYASRMIYYARPYGVKVFTLDDKNRQFALWEGEPATGYDLLIVSSRFGHDDVGAQMVCREVRPMGSLTLTRNGGIVDTFAYTLCAGYGGMR